MTGALSRAVADKLVEAHRRVRALDVDNDQKARATRRLLAISDASKQDLQRAAKRLDAFFRDLDQGQISAADGPEPAP